jgi:acetoin utilization deacetylase AcuC-like enzyme
VDRGASAAARDALVPIDGRAARFTELARVHDELYLEALAQLASAGGGELDPDTRMSAGSWTTAVDGAGLALSAVEALERGEGDAAFVAPRPPGHHATRARGMGFCLLNNVAVAAAALAADGRRVLVLDWDVHHGNGTQEMFWDEPAVLYVSLHQWPAYPGTGRATETGGPGAPGGIVNVPLCPGATGDVVLLAIDEVVAPVVDRFGPDWVLVSAGYDAHRDDPLADLALSAGDYADLTRRAMAFAPAAGRLVVVLEGGYDLGALERSTAATVATLAGMDLRPEPVTCGGPGRELVAAADRSRTRSLGGPP